jgi:hypothetical protein
MQGSIRQRSKGTWQLRYEAPPDGCGKRKYLSETVKGTKKDAERALRGCVRNRVKLGNCAVGWRSGALVLWRHEQETIPERPFGYAQGTYIEVVD